MRRRTRGETGAMSAWNRRLAGGGSRSTVGIRRTRSSRGVGSTRPKPSGRRGSGLAPICQESSRAPGRRVYDGRGVGAAGRGGRGARVAVVGLVAGVPGVRVVGVGGGAVAS